MLKVVPLKKHWEVNSKLYHHLMGEQQVLHLLSSLPNLILPVTSICCSYSSCLWRCSVIRRWDLVRKVQRERERESKRETVFRINKPPSAYKHLLSRWAIPSWLRSSYGNTLIKGCITEMICCWNICYCISSLSACVAKVLNHGGLGSFRSSRDTFVA